MRLLKTTLAAGAVVGVLAGSAFAADMPHPPVIKHTPEYEAEIGGNWYLRGDIGYAIYDHGDWTYGPNGTPAVYFEQVDIDNTWMIGVGLGYQFNSYFRSDVTLDYRFDAKASNASNCAGGCTSYDNADIASLALLFNGYVELGSWHGFTPYVGAGVGFAHVSMEGWTSTNPATNIADNSDWNFAWALMAGGAYEVVDGMKIDFGYRYLHLGEVDSGIDAPAPANYATLDDLAVHEIRVGLRYDIW